MLTPRTRVLRHWEQVRGARSGVLQLTIHHPPRVTIDCLGYEGLVTSRLTDTAISCTVGSDFDPIVIVIIDEQGHHGFAAVTPRVLGDVKEVVDSEKGELALVERSYLTPMAVVSHHNSFQSVTAEILFQVRDSCVDVICDVCKRVSQRCQCTLEARNDHLKEVADEILGQLLRNDACCNHDDSEAVTETIEEHDAVDVSAAPPVEVTEQRPPVIMEAEVEDVTPVRRVYSTKCCNFM